MRAASGQPAEELTAFGAVNRLPPGDLLSGGLGLGAAEAGHHHCHPQHLFLENRHSQRALEDFLARYPGACLFVTHDRYFLDRIATRILELTRGAFISYQGSYNDFLLAKAAREATEEENERKRQKFLKHELEWVRSVNTSLEEKQLEDTGKLPPLAG